ncbi:sulfotransferase family protein [Marinobacter sp. Arc7-DN-1]|uniref:sulfotransferase family protein n=1 Tax=Marinobacter sp. Arc7-DN-1 TaxID=2304594 RepID=UPI000E450388|nr:sulfotransferase [Marinobacter sp. Arc7-DN-1]AXS82510.1 sulfotransferase [Marinobacter sp. Arc7-DN-1]
MSNTDVIIVGAPRSGTNMLRDVLTSFDGVSTWPCDEINYIWRHGNVRYPSDEIPAQRANPAIKNYIRQRFSDIREKYNADVVVEKTCANSLRVPFVDAVLPDAKYIFIYRDGIDATGSAKERWTAKLDIPYILEKVRFVPKTDLPYYGLRYFWARLYRFISRERRLAFWGPALDGMESVLQNHTLNEVCALQWQRCVDNAEKAFSDMPTDKVVRVRYEDFVRQPVEELSRILEFIGKEVEPEKIAKAVEGVSPRSLGKGRNALGGQEVANLEALVGETLKRYDYL